MTTLFSSVPKASARNNYWLDLFWLSLILFIVFGAWLGTRAIGVPDEGRYSEIPREMLVLKDFITPHIDYIKYFEKPPLFYWMQAASISLFGLNTWALRLANALMAWLGCLATYGVARALWSRRTGWWAALILATSILYGVMAHIYTLDMTVSVWLTLTLYALLLATQAPPQSKKSCFFFLSAYVFSGLAMMTKGLIGILLPGMVMFLWLWCYNRWSLLKSAQIPLGLCLFLAINLPWLILVQHRNPEFFHYYFITQQFTRYFTMHAHRYQGPWFFIPVLLLGLFPWITFLPAAVKTILPPSWPWQRQQRPWPKEHEIIGFLLIWVVSIFLFFSFSHSKLIPYLLPIFPGLALIIAYYFEQSWEKLRYSFKLGLTVLTLLTIAIAIGIQFAPSFIPTSHLQFAHWLLASIGIFLVLGMLTANYFCRQQKKDATIITLIVTFSLFLMQAALFSAQLDLRSIKPLAEVLLPYLTPHSSVVCYDHYYQDLPVYLQRRVKIVGWKNELGFGMRYQNTSGWVLTKPEFWQLWDSAQPVYMVLRQTAFADLPAEHPNSHFYILASTSRNLLVSNQLK